MNNDVPDSFKMTELGHLPEEWRVVHLGDVFEFSRKPRGVLREDTEIPFIPMEHISDNSSRINGWQLKNVSEISSGTFVLKNDLVIAKITPSFENGKQAILDNLPEAYGYATTEIWALHPRNQTAIVEYLYNYLKIPPIRADLASKMEGSTGRQRLPRRVLQNLQFPLPPLAEQQAIARVLFTVQEAREKTEAAIDATRELKKSLMKHLFTYGPVPFQEADKVALKETEIGLMPEDWDVVKIGDVASVQGGYAFKSEDYVPHGIPLFKISNVSFGRTAWDDISFLPMEYVNEYRNYLLKSGDLVMAMTRPIVAGGIKVTRLCDRDAPCLLNQRVCRFNPKNQFSIEYLFHILFDVNFVRSISEGALGSQQPNISAKKIESIVIPHPQPQIQQQVAHILTSVDHKVIAQENKKAALDSLFQTLLQNLMTAKIRVKQKEAEA